MAEFRSKFRVEHDSVNIFDHKRVPDPPGYDPAAAREAGGSSAGSSSRPAVSLKAREAALMSQSLGSLKNVAMLCFMMWMSGSQLHLFSIMMTINGFYQPFSSIMKVKEAFPADPEGKLNVALPRLAFCCIQGCGVMFALYKINAMGLFPTHLSDWVSSIKAPTFTEQAVTSILPPPQ